jgi:hypothetical protein
MLTGHLGYGSEARRADINACTALNTFILVNNMDQSLTAGNSLSRAVAHTEHASLAFIRQYVKRYQILAG